MAKKAKAAPVYEDMSFQRLEWRIERVGWLLMALAIAAALLGLIGSGPLSSASRSTYSLKIEYERFLHYQASSSYRVHIQGRGGLHLNQSLLNSVKLSHIVPRPQKMELTQGGVTLHFDVGNAERSTVTIPFEAEKVGRLQAEFALPGEPPLRVTQFVYP